MKAYLYFSLVLRYILKGEEAIQHALTFTQIASSELMDIECRRVFFRCRLAGVLDDAGMNLCARALGFGTPLAG